jgi:phosphoribosylformimino-5-aminoimidazole carboxamide ribotide isomerase
VTNSWTKTVRVIPVLDVKERVAVHAKGGDRLHYAPVRSILHEDADPFSLARAFRDLRGSTDLYLADLSAIRGKPPDLELIRNLSSLGLSIWIDAGLREAKEAPALFDSGATTVVAGLETIRGPSVLHSLIDNFGPDRIAFSLDLRDGQPIVCEDSNWSSDQPIYIATAAYRVGVRRMIVLDLGRVGSGSGVGTMSLISTIRERHPSIEITAGGGVSGVSDLHSLQAAGAVNVLVGSALHDGRLRP